MNSETPRDSSVNSKTHKETYSPRIPFLLGRGGSIILVNYLVLNYFVTYFSLKSIGLQISVYRLITHLLENLGD